MAVLIVYCLKDVGDDFMADGLKNKYVRVAVGACLVIVVTFILRTDEYMGAGAELIEKAVENGQADTFAFFWKMVLTALTMRAGFRGGEIVPSFCIGATFGCVVGNLMGISPSICAACGMAAVFLRCDQLSDHFDPDRF